MAIRQGLAKQHRGVLVRRDEQKIYGRWWRWWWAVVGDEMGREGVKLKVELGEGRQVKEWRD